MKLTKKNRMIDSVEGLSQIAENSNCRGLIYAENKPIGRLCKMQNPFFHEFRASPSANVFQFVCYTATFFTTEAVDQRIDPGRYVAHLSRRREAGGHDLFRFGSLQMQATWPGTAELPDTAKSRCW
jgi:hypothetical protein